MNENRFPGQLRKVSDPTVAVFIDPDKYGVKDRNGNVLAIRRANTSALNPKYTYHIYVDSNKPKMVYLDVHSHINAPFLIEADVVIGRQ